MSDDLILEERVDDLETILGRFIVQTSTSLKRFEREMVGFKNEMKIFKDEMSDFKAEMKYFKDEMLGFKNEMKDFKDEILGFKDGVHSFKDETSSFATEMRNDRRNMNKQWGELANKMGSLMKDIVAPAVRPVIRKYFNCDIINFQVNRKRKNRALNLEGEFDVIAVSDDDRVFLTETKSYPKEEYLHKFVDRIELFKQIFPEYSEMKVFPFFASLRFDDKLIRSASEKNIYILAYREWDYMDILNFDELKSESV